MMSGESLHHADVKNYSILWLLLDTENLD